MNRRVWPLISLLVAGSGGCDDRHSATDADAHVGDGAVADAALIDVSGADPGVADAGEPDASPPCDAVQFELEDEGATVCAAGFSLDLWERGALGAGWRWRIGGQCDEAVVFVDVDVPQPPPPRAFLPVRLLGGYTTGLAEEPGGTSRWIGGRDETNDSRPLGQLVEGEVRADERCLSGSARLILVPPTTDNVDRRPSVEVTVRWRGPATPL